MLTVELDAGNEIHFELGIINICNHFKYNLVLPITLWYEEEDTYFTF